MLLNKLDPIREWLAAPIKHRLDVSSNWLRDRIEARIDRVQVPDKPRMHCGVLITGTTIESIPVPIPENMPQDMKLRGRSFRDVSFPFIHGAYEMLGPGQASQIDIKPQRPIANLTIIAYGPCIITAAMCGPHLIDIWNGGTSCAFNREAVTPGMQLSFQVQAWQW